MRDRRSVGQSTAEYATLLVIIIGAITVMQLFLKRGMNAGIREATVTHYLNAGVGENGLAGTAQFEPYYSTSHTDSSADSSKVAYVKGGGGYHQEFTTKVQAKGWENQLAVNGYENEDNWGWNKSVNELVGP